MILAKISIFHVISGEILKATRDGRIPMTFELC